MHAAEGFCRARQRLMGWRVFGCSLSFCSTIIMQCVRNHYHIRRQINQSSKWFPNNFHVRLTSLFDRKHSVFVRSCFNRVRSCLTWKAHQDEPPFQPRPFHFHPSPFVTQNTQRRVEDIGRIRTKIGNGTVLKTFHSLLCINRHSTSPQKNSLSLLLYPQKTKLRQRPRTQNSQKVPPIVFGLIFPRILVLFWE
jgi:hypothetical protein